VGYAIRFDRRISKDTRLEVVTEGILARRLIDDPALEGVAMIIFDEFHERSLQADLGLALSLDIQRSLRDDLKLLVMSATIDTAPVAALLGSAPVITAAGETFPVTVHFSSQQGRPEGRGEGWKERLVGAVRTALRDTTGDILVFLPGAGEIHQAAERLQDVIARWESPSPSIPFTETCLLRAGAGHHARTSPEDRAGHEHCRNEPHHRRGPRRDRRRPGPEAPVRPGNRHEPPRHGHHLPASAIQRQGRAGRLGPGVCYRLYSRYVYDSMIPFAPPQILISDLSSLVLDLATWGVRDPGALAWLDPPPQAAWEAAGPSHRPRCPEPRRHSDPDRPGHGPLSLHPRLGRLLLRAADSGHLRLGADLAALLSERDIMRRYCGGTFLEEVCPPSKFAGRKGQISANASQPFSNGERRRTRPLELELTPGL